VGNYGIAPSEYWRMTPSEVFLLMEAKTPEQRFGNVTESQLESLFEVYQKGEFA
jgi:hypothetical protein